MLKIESFYKDKELCSARLSNGWWIDIVHFNDSDYEDLTLGLQHDDIDLGQIRAIDGEHRVGMYGCKDEKELIQWLIDSGVIAQEIRNAILEDIIPEYDDYDKLMTDAPWLYEYVTPTEILNCLIGENWDEMDVIRLLMYHMH